jgi:hypothetical protein
MDHRVCISDEVLIFVGVALRRGFFIQGEVTHCRADLSSSRRMSGGQEEMKFEEARLATFRGWPANAKVDPFIPVSYNM